MSDLRNERVHRELFVGAFGASVGRVEPWVTDRLVSLIEEHDLAAGSTLFSAGDPPDYCYFLREGLIELSRPGHPPQTRGKNTFFGVSEALLERPRSHTARGLTDLRTVRLPSHGWVDLLEDSFSVARAAVEGSVGVVAALEQQLWSTGGDLRPRPAWRPEPGAEFDLVDRLGVLTETSLLRGAGVQTLSDLAAASSVIPFERNEVLIARGPRRGRVLLLLEGEVEARREDPPVAWRGGPGDVACGTAAFGDAVTAWEARARTPGRALVFQVSDWLDLMEVHFEMLRATLSALSDARDELLERLSGEHT